MAEAVPELTTELYDHLRNLARRIHSERGHGQATVQPTVLLHEAWAKVAGAKQRYESKAHFMAVAATAMRQILVDHARARARLKRGGDARRTTLTGLGDDNQSPLDLLALDEALGKLEGLDSEAAKLVLMRVFGGLTVAEAAEVMGVSPRSVARTWRFARSYLATQLG